MLLYHDGVGGGCPEEIFELFSLPFGLPVFSEICAQLDHSLLLEFARECIARASAETS